MPKSLVNFNTTEEDFYLIQEIIEFCQKNNITDEEDWQHHNMNLCACHMNGCPLDLEKMLASKDKFNLTHDIWGIDANINRKTGKLENHFWPRYAVKQ